MGRRGLHNEGAELMTRAAGRQDRHRFRHRAPAVHPGLRAAPAGVGAMKIDGIAYRSVWVDRGRRLVGPHHRPDQAALVAGDPAPDRRATQAAHAIRAMQTRGAPLIGAVAAYGLCLALRADASTEAMERDAALLAATRPTAVNLRWALDRMLTRLRNTRAGGTRRRRLRRGRRRSPTRTSRRTRRSAGMGCR